jgi:hypothetical protein
VLDDDLLGYVLFFELGEASFFDLCEERASNFSGLYNSSSSSASLAKILGLIPGMQSRVFVFSFRILLVCWMSFGLFAAPLCLAQVHVVQWNWGLDHHRIMATGCYRMFTLHQLPSW